MTRKDQQTKEVRTFLKKNITAYPVPDEAYANFCYERGVKGKRRSISPTLFDEEFEKYWDTFIAERNPAVTKTLELIAYCLKTKSKEKINAGIVYKTLTGGYRVKGISTSGHKLSLMIREEVALAAINQNLLKKGF